MPATPKRYSTSVYINAADGRPIRKTVHAKTKKELTRKVELLKIEAENGKNVSDRGVFRVWAEKWLDELKLPSGLAPGTITQYRSNVNRLVEEFGDREMKSITLSEFQVFINRLAAENPSTGQPTAKSTLSKIIKAAAGIFEYAQANNLSGVPYFFRAVRIPRSAPVKKRRSLTEEEIDRILELPHRAQLPAVLMLFSGLRRGELIALRWSDVDLERAVIRVRRAATIISNRATEKAGGKTANATRNISIPPYLVSYLRAYKSANRPAPMGYVCTNVNGEMHTKSSWDKLWDSYLLDMNLRYGYGDSISKFDPIKMHDLPMLIDPITPHYLRHTFATLLYLQGVDVVTAKRLLGHADIATTVNIYTDLETMDKSTLSPAFLNHLQTDYKISK